MTYIKSAVHRSDINGGHGRGHGRGHGSAVSLQLIAVGTLQKPSPLYHSDATGFDITPSNFPNHP
jgi:hypothetical protein